ncbi:hypothetical protein Tco_0685442, partial [Tanacetum coccineum]
TASSGVVAGLVGMVI